MHLLDWLTNLRAVDKEVTGGNLLNGARIVAIRLGIEEKYINESWVQRWRQMYGVKYQTVHGEANDCPDFSDWRKGILNLYKKEDVWNADETALYWHMSSDKTFTLEQEKAVRGRKQMKSRVTILVCCSMEGEKVPSLCIGTAAKPRWHTVLGRRANAPVPHTSSEKG